MQPDFVFHACVELREKTAPRLGQFTRHTTDAREQAQLAGSSAALGLIAGRAASAARPASSIPDRAYPRAQAVMAPAAVRQRQALPPRPGPCARPLDGQEQRRTRGGSGGREVWLCERATPNRDRGSATQPTAAPR